MFKKCIFVLIIPVLLFSNELVTKTFKFGNPIVKDNAIHMSGCRTIVEGFVPSVAVKGVRLALPVGHEAESFNVIYGKMITLDEKHYLKPVTPPITIGKARPVNYGKIESPVYNQRSFFPALKRSSSFTTQYKTGIPVFIATVNPTQYNPISGEIRYFESITVEVKLKKVSRAELPYYNCTRAMKSMLQQTIDNPEAVYSLPYTQKDGDDYEYLIITSDLLKDAWGDMIDFNKRRAMRTKVFTVQHIQNEMTTGANDNEKVRNFIKQEFTDHKIVYVLLGGDMTSGANYSVPSPTNFYCKFYDHHIETGRLREERDICTDMFFSTLDTDWKKDPGDAYYGTYPCGDWYWEVYASRFPVDNASEVDNLVAKTIKYSEQPVRSEVKNTLMLGNLLWDWTGTNKKIWGAMFMDELWGDGPYSGSSYTDYQGHDYTTYRIPATGWKIDSLYDRSIGSWNINNLKSKVTSLKPTWIDHAGHGNVNAAFAVTTQTATNSNFTNDGSNANFFIVTSQACKPSSFHAADECLMEALMNISNGAIITSGSTHSGQLDDDGTDGSGNRPYRWLHDALFNPQKRVHYWEMMHALGKEVDIDIVTKEDLMVAPYHNCLRFMHFIINTMGDPALSIWTETPKDLTQPFEYIATKSEFTMKTPPYTWVALADNSTGEIFTTQLTGYVYADDSFTLGDSTCSIDDTPYKTYASSHDKVKVIIKAHNYLPFEKVVDLQNVAIVNNDWLVNNTFHITSANGRLIINFTLKNNNHMNLSLYNSKGAKVKTLINSNVEVGSQSVTFDNGDLSKGVYYCRLRIGTINSIKKVIISH